MQKIAIIIPCYNEEKRLKHKDIEYLVTHTDISIYFANDGSKDSTSEIIKNIENQFLGRCFAINYKENEGKAQTIFKAINFLILNKNYDYLGYFDADFSTPNKEVIRIINELKANNYDFIFGSRVKLLNAKINRKWYRHVIGRIIITLINFKLRLGIYDTQCGAKILKTSLAKVAFSSSFFTSWLFDVEVFIRLNNKQLLQNAKEFPLLEWEDVGGSKLGWKTALKIMRELYLINKKY